MVTLNKAISIFAIMALFVILPFTRETHAEIIQKHEIKQNKLKLACQLTAKGDFFFKKEKKIIIKGISYNPMYPGETVADMPRKADFRKDFRLMKAANINTIMLYKLGSEKLYRAAKEAGLYILQGIWIDNNVEDFQDAKFKKKIKRSILWHADMINNYGRRYGDAQLKKKRDNDYSELIIAYWLGGEFELTAIESTDATHPDIKEYKGEYIKAPMGSTATECFIAEMCDYMTSYEMLKYNKTHYVSHINWPVAQPYMECKFLSVQMFDVYEYWPNAVVAAPPGSYTKTNYQGYLEELKEEYKNIPLIISEFGFSTAPENPVDTGSSEKEQAKRLMYAWIDIITSKNHYAGGSVFEWNDEWWKQAKCAEKFDRPFDMKHHEKDDPEEWFGIISIDGINSKKYEVRKKMSYHIVKKMFNPFFNPKAYFEADRFP